MSSLDLILTGISFLGGAIVSATISWIFFRAQQNTDFNKLKDSITALSKDSITALSRFDTKISLIQEAIKTSEQKTDRVTNTTDLQLGKIGDNLQDIKELMGQVKEVTNIATKLDDSKEIASLKSIVERLDYTLENSVDSIITEVRNQQTIISNAVQDSFKTQSNNAVKDILKYLKNDLDRILPSSFKEKEDLLIKLHEIMSQALNTMGQYQLLTLKQKQNNSLDNIVETEKQKKQILSQGIKTMENILEQIAPLPPSKDS